MSSISTFLLTRTQKEPFMSCLQMPILPLRIMLHVKSTANMQLVQMKRKFLGRVANTSWSVNCISPLMRESLVPLTLDGVLLAPLKKKKFIGKEKPYSCWFLYNIFWRADANRISAATFFSQLRPSHVAMRAKTLWWNIKEAIFGECYLDQERLTQFIW